MTKLPKNWREICDERDGTVLYLQRVCGRYWVRFECGEWWSYLSTNGDGCGTGVAIGKGPTRDHALLICREHMHAQQVPA